MSDDVGVIPEVLANEVTCRLWLKELEKRGCTFDPPPEKLTHEECIELGVKIYSHIVRMEKSR